MIFFAINLVVLILCLSSLFYYCFGIYAAIAFLNHPHLIDTKFHPCVTILKPICGLDEDGYENLASFCQQDYPEYQIIFTVREANDSAVPVVKQIINDFPGLDIQLIINPSLIGSNLKVSNLANGVSAAKHQILVIADSDIRVNRNYLQQVIQPLQDNSIGAVTCMYRSVAQGWVATLEAVGIATEFHAGVLVSNQIEGIKFGLGSTIAIRKEVLEKIGGFQAIANYLADDYQLGYLSVQAGYKVILSDYVVEHMLATSTFTDAIQRQVRWSRCIRVSRPWGYLGLIFTYGTVTSLAILIATKGSIFSYDVLIITWIIRLTMGWLVGVKILNDPIAKEYLWLIFLRDFISFGIWCYGFFGNTIKWRGERFNLTKDGKLILIK